jgi:hypothetical protein
MTQTGHGRIRQILTISELQVRPDRTLDLQRTTPDVARIRLHGPAIAVQTCAEGTRRDCMCDIAFFAVIVTVMSEWSDDF